MRRIGIALVTAVLLSGCGIVRQQPAYSETPPPPPPQVYQKAGATKEEFQRTKAACLGRAEIAQSGSVDPNPLARAGTWMMVYRTCMRSDGWVLVNAPSL